MKAPERVMVLCCIDLRRPDLRPPDLRRADLRPPNLRRADLRPPDLRRADLRPPDLRRADPRPPDPRPPDPPRSAKRIPDASPPDREAARLFERVIAAVTAFCPAVEVAEPGVCAFGARGPARYFGGETALAAQIIAAVAELGVESRAGVADGLFAALLAARPPSPAHPASPASDSGPIRWIPPGGTAGFLAAQPVVVLAEQGRFDQDLIRLLTRLGLGTLGDLAALPASDVASRFGDAGEAAHRLARGLDARPLMARPPATDLSVTREFDPPEPRAEPVVFAAKALAEQLHTGLAARGLTCVRVQVRASWANGSQSTRLWRHDGLLTAAGVADRVRWQLDGAPAAAEDGEEYAFGGIATLRLLPDQVVRATGHQLALWGETVVSDGVARAAMRVQAMLGHEAVLRPVPGGGRNVSEQVSPVPFGEKREPRLAAAAPWPGRIMGAAPGLVYPAAREAEVTDDDGRLVTVTGRCVLSAPPARLAVEHEPPRRVTAWAGPWPLSERWWDPVAARRRARFQLATDDGRAWLAVVQDGRWLIEAGYWLWAGITRRFPGANSNAGCPGARRAAAHPARCGPRNRPRPRCPGGRRALSRGPNCTVIPRSASWTGRPLRTNSSPKPPGSAWRCWPSPTTTGCTRCRSSRRPRRGCGPTAPGWARCSAPSSALACHRARAACPTRPAVTC